MADARDPDLFSKIFIPLVPGHAGGFEPAKHFMSVRIGWAMFYDAVVQAVEHAENEEGIEAWEWIRAHNGFGDESWAYSFDSVCTALKLDPIRVREAIAKLPKGTFAGRGGRNGRRGSIGGTGTPGDD